MTEPTQPEQQEQEPEQQSPPVKKRLLRDRKVHLTAAAAGFIIASAVAFMGGTPVAWGTPVYFVLGWPLMCAVIYFLARAYPHNNWRWTLSMMLGQVFSSIFFGNANFILQAMLFVTLLSIPQFVAGAFGARAGKARQAQHGNPEHSTGNDDTSSQDKL